MKKNKIEAEKKKFFFYPNCVTSFIYLLYYCSEHELKIGFNTKILNEVHLKEKQSKHCNRHFILRWSLPVIVYVSLAILLRVSYVAPIADGVAISYGIYRFKG